MPALGEVAFGEVLLGVDEVLDQLAIRRFELVREGGKWLITDVVMTPEDTRLTEVLAESINDAEP